MSGADKPDQEQGFLARWSQRKQEAQQLEPKPDAPAAEPAEQIEPVAPEPEPEFDLSTLPKLEELTGTTDITAFLQKGVPEQIRNAALRKSWALDPAIRNYVNPALEYAYDWNTPGGVPGNGELGAGIDIAKMVSQIMGDAPAAEPDSPSGGHTSAPPDIATEPVPAEPLPDQSVRRVEQAESAERADEAAIPPTASEPPDLVALQQPVRRHGSAKPIV